MSRRALQVVITMLGVIPVVTGMLTMMGLGDPIYADAGLPANALLDSNMRFLGGMWLVLGLALFVLIPRIERETMLFRTLWLMIFAGGVGRLLSMVFVGAPPWPFVGFTLLEGSGGTAVHHLASSAGHRDANDRSQDKCLSLRRDRFGSTVPVDLGEQRSFKRLNGSGRHGAGADDCCAF